MRKLVPSHLKSCATCSFWTGGQRPFDASCMFIEVDYEERAKCIGGGMHNATMGPTASCLHWKQRFMK